MRSWEYNIVENTINLVQCYLCAVFSSAKTVLEEVENEIAYLESQLPCVMITMKLYIYIKKVCVVYFTFL